MIPKIAHMVWLGPKPIPEMYHAEMDFLGGFGFSFYLWHEPTLHQLGLSPDNWEHSTYAASANIIRLHALHKYGGLYFDSDVEWLKDPSPLLEYEEFIARQPDGVFCNAVMGAKAGSDWIRQQLELLSDFRLHDAAHACHIIHLAESENLTVVPTHWFYPFGHDETADRSRITDETLCVHHWDGSWL